MNQQEQKSHAYGAVARRALRSLQLGIIYATTAVSIVCLVVLLVLVIAGVANRAFPVVPSVPRYESLSGYLLVAIASFGLPGSFDAGVFIRVRILQIAERPSAIRLFEVLTFLFAGLLTWYAWDLVHESWKYEIDNVGGPEIKLYLLQLPMAIGFSLFTFYLLLRILANRSPARPDAEAAVKPSAL